MPNGYFSEEFVRFVDPADDRGWISLPFMIQGIQNNASFVEKPIYDLVREKKKMDSTIMFQNLDISSTSVSAACYHFKWQLLSHKEARWSSDYRSWYWREMRKVHSLQLDENGNVLYLNFTKWRCLLNTRQSALRNIENLHATVCRSDTNKNQWEGTPSDHRKELPTL